MKIGVPDPQGTEFICRLKSNNSDPDPSIKLKKKKKAPVRVLQVVHGSIFEEEKNCN